MYELKNSLRFLNIQNNLFLYSINSLQVLRTFSIWVSEQRVFVYVTSRRFWFGLALTVDFFFITYIGVRGINNVLFIHEFGLGTIDWCAPSGMPCDMRTLSVTCISITSECKQNAVSAVGAPWTRSVHAVTTWYTQWKRRKSAMRAQAIAN